MKTDVAKALVDACAAEAKRNGSPVRLGQLISNMLTGKTTTDRDRDLFYMTDAEFVKRLKEVYGG